MAKLTFIESTINPMNSVYGTQGNSQNFFFRGEGIVDKVTVTAPPNFEVSLDNVTFAGSVERLNVQDNFIIPAYVRVKKSTVSGTYSGNITLSSTDAVSITKSIPLSTVRKATLVVTADNKTKFYRDQNPPLTVRFSGFVNGETSTALTKQPDLTTPVTVDTPEGVYPINASRAESPNYIFQYIAGYFTVKKGTKPTIPDIIEETNVNIQYQWLLDHGSLQYTFSKNYLEKMHVFSYEENTDKATFIVSTYQGVAHMVLVDTKSVNT